MPKGVPKNGNNKGWFKNGDMFWKGKKRSDEDKEKMSKPKSKKYIELERKCVCMSCAGEYVKSIHNQIYCKTCVPNKFASGLMTKYKLSYPKYLELLKVINGKCEICLTDKATDIDHDHKTGSVRGILCHNCNVALGHMKDDIKILTRSIEYLMKQNYGK